MFLLQDSIDMLGYLLDSKSFRGYVKVLLPVEKIRKNGINFLEVVLVYLMTVCKYVLETGEELNRKDPAELYKKVSKGKQRLGIGYKWGLEWHLYYQTVVRYIDKMDIDFNNKLKLKFDKIDKFWKIIQQRFQEDVEKGVKGGIDRADFIRDYTNSAKVSLLVWQLPNHVLFKMEQLYSLGTIFDISHILGERKR